MHVEEAAYLGSIAYFSLSLKGFTEPKDARRTNMFSVLYAIIHPMWRLASYNAHTR